MEDKTKKKRDNELRVVEEMILLYCRAHHHDTPCARCQELIDYARIRTHKCPFMETKTFCSNCQVHCYDRVHREQIRKVMRYSGKRMLFHHPMLAMFHLLSTTREKRRLKKGGRK